MAIRNCSIYLRASIPARHQRQIAPATLPNQYKPNDHRIVVRGPVRIRAVQPRLVVVVVVRRAGFLGKLGAGFGVGGMQRVILAYMGRARRTCAMPLPTGHRRRSRKDGGNCQSSSGLVQCYPEVACNVAVYGLAEQRRLHAPFRRGSSRECDVFASM